MTPDERELCNDIRKAREHLARLEEDLLILRSNQPQRPAITVGVSTESSTSWPLGVNPDLISDDGE